MQIKLDKTVLLVAATKALSEIKKQNDPPMIECDLQEIVDLLSSKNSKFIQSVSLDSYEYSLIEPFLEDI